MDAARQPTGAAAHERWPAAAAAAGETPSGYRAGLVAHHVPTEWRRLQLQEQLMDGDSIRLLRPRVTSSSRCLELGAGAGSVARWLARRCHWGHVTATDIDLDFLAESPGPNLAVLRHDVAAETFPEGSFDLIHARALFVHLEQRDSVLRKVVSWLAPGGHVVIEEPCMFPVDSSPYPEFARLMQAFRAGMEASGVTVTDWARGLPLRLARCGLSDVRLEVSPQYVGHHDLWHEYWRLFIDQVGEVLVRTGLLTTAQLQSGLELMESPDFVDMPLAYIAACARRTPEGLAASDVPSAGVSRNGRDPR